MSTLSRAHLIEALSQAIQQMGNRTVLFTHAIADHVGLSATEFECLDLVRQHDGIPAGQIARLTGLTSGAITGVIDRLERTGFVRRTIDPTDRRRVLIEHVHNEYVHRRVSELYEPVVRGYETIVEHYSDNELELIIRYLNESLTLISNITETMRQPGRE